MTLKNKLQKGLFLASGLASALSGCGEDSQKERCYVAKTPEYAVSICELPGYNGSPAFRQVVLRAVKESIIPYEIIGGDDNMDGSWDGLTIGIKKGESLGTIPFDKKGPVFELNATKCNLEQIMETKNKLDLAVEKFRKTEYEVDRTTYLEQIRENQESKWIAQNVLTNGNQGFQPLKNVLDVSLD